VLGISGPAKCRRRRTKILGLERRRVFSTADHAVIKAASTRSSLAGYTHKLEPGDDPKAIAGRLTKTIGSWCEATIWAASIGG
jgi:hypothetical protein